MPPIFVASADDVIEQLIVQCGVFEARDGDYDGARLRAERTLERLLAGGLPAETGPHGLRLDPYGAGNRLKSRIGEPADDAWADWQRTTRRNAVSLPPEPHRYRFVLRREWHQYVAAPARPVVLRLPLPLGNAQQGAAKVRLIEPSAGLLEVRETPGRLELRVDSALSRGPIVAELEVEFVAGDRCDPLSPSALLGASNPGDEIWLREREGFIVPSPRIALLAGDLARGQRTVREFAYAAWEWLMTHLRFGDVHREQLDQSDALGGLLRNPLADCALGSSLLVALCRARGIPARLVSGFLLHPANLGPHTWAEVRLSPDAWVPFDYGSWCYCAGDARDPLWGQFFRGRVDARYCAEIAPRDFTGWGSAPPPERWYRLERLRGGRIEHTLHTLPHGALFRRDILDLHPLRPAGCGQIAAE